MVRAGGVGLGNPGAPSMNSVTKDSPSAHLLVVEDSSVFREMQDLLLGQAGYAVSSHEHPRSALDAAARRKFDLVVIDYELPDMNGQEFMHALRKIHPDIAVIFVSGSLTVDLAVELSSQGVAGIFNKPANPKTLLEKINETLARHAVRDTAARIGSGSPLAGSKRALSDSPFYTAAAEPQPDELAYVPRFFFGASDKFRDFTHRLWKVRDFRAVLLLQGAPGSAFELFARDLVEISIFQDGPVMVCEAADFESRRLLEVLAPSLLSHDAGTLVVTGVETFNAEQQQVLQKLISGRDVFLPFARRFRVVLASTGRLSERVDEGTFDETLYYKISSLSLSVPSLRDMRGDIPANASRILTQLAEDGDDSIPTGFTPEAAEWLETQKWPGNYEQLAGTLQRAVAFAEGPELTIAALESGLHQPENKGEKRARPPAPAALTGSGENPTGEARPPFPLSSALASEPASDGDPPVAASSAVKPATTGTASPFPPAAPVRALNATSLFRPASGSYDFNQRLTDSLASA